MATATAPRICLLAAKPTKLGIDSLRLQASVSCVVLPIAFSSLQPEPFHVRPS